MNSRQKQKGFTLVEMVVVAGFLAAVAVLVGVGIVVVHFIGKFW